MPLNFLLCLPSMPLGWRQLSLTAIFLSDWYLLNLRPNFCVGLEEVEKRKGLELGTRTKLSCARVGRDRAAARSPSRGRRTTRRGVRGSCTQRAVVWVRRARGASSTKEQQLSSPEPTPAQPPSRARARGMVFARRAQRTLTILAFVIGWTMVTLFRSGCLRPRYGLPTHSVLCSPSLPSTEFGLPRRRRRGAGARQDGESTRGNAPRGTDMGFLHKHFWKRERRSLLSLFLTFFPNEFSDGGLQVAPKRE